jgi:hypothetical protein
LGERLYLPSIVVPIAAGMAALFTAWILNVHGIQPLSEPEMISAGRQVSTALFSAKATMVFAISGFALLGCGLISLTRQLLKIRNALHAER